MAPTLVASYFVKSATQGTSALTTPSFTPSNGEVVVVKLETWDTGTSMGAPTGGSQTYTSRVTVAPGGFRPWVGIYTAVISGSPGAMTVSSTPSASARYSMTVERWSGAQLAATPATGSNNAGTGAASGTITTAAANSIITWAAGDAQSVDPATRAYLNSATDEGVRDDHVGANGVGYHAYQSAASSGSQSFGLSAPTGMQFCIAGLEVQDAAGGSTPKSISETGSAADTATVAASVPLADAASSSEAVTAAATAPLADTASSSEALTIAVTVPLADTASGVDSVDNGTGTAKALSDTGSASEALTVAVTASLADVASAAEALTIAAALALADAASAVQAFAVTAFAVLTDTATTAEGLTATVSLALADTASAVDVGTGSDGTSVNKALADAGSATERIRITVARPNTGTVTRPDTGRVTRPYTGTVYRP